MAYQSVSVDTLIKAGMTRSEYLEASPEMFASRFLDFFIRSHPRTLILFYAAVIGGLTIFAIRRNSRWWMAGLAAAGSKR